MLHITLGMLHSSRLGRMFNLFQFPFNLCKLKHVLRKHSFWSTVANYVKSCLCSANLVMHKSNCTKNTCVLVSNQSFVRIIMLMSSMQFFKLVVALFSQLSLKYSARTSTNLFNFRENTSFCPELWKRNCSLVLVQLLWYENFGMFGADANFLPKI